MAECFNKMGITLKEPFYDDQGKLTYEVSVPCGKCENCISRRRMEWGFRMEREMEESKTCLFVTLTYDQEHLPWDKYGNMILVKRDMINFMKQLRTNHKRNKIVRWEHWYNGLTNNDKIKFYGCGEYGEGKLTGNGQRPHYHLILFNASEAIIQETWKKGASFIVKGNRATIGYVTKYLDKWKDKKQDWRKPREFNLQSLGIGKSYIDKMAKWHSENLEINNVVNKQGITIPMPRYYRMRMLSEYQITIQRMMIHNKLQAQQKMDTWVKGEDKYNEDKLMKIRFTKTKFNKGLKNRM